MPPRLRAIVLTPDFPPDSGGIQLLVSRVVQHFSRVECMVVTTTRRNSANSDAQFGFVIRRIPPILGQSKTRLAMLNLGGCLAGIRWRPQVVLSAHVAVAPAAIALSRLLRIPYVQYFYGMEVTAHPGLTRASVANARTVIVISRYTANLLEQVGARSSETVLIHPGTDLLSPPGGSYARDAVILTVSRVAEFYKGHDVLLRAIPIVLSKVPGARWVVIGDGPLLGPFERLTSALGLGGIVDWLGAVPDRVRDEWFAKATVFAMVSRLQPDNAGEGFGIVYLEAAAHGLPVVAGNCGGAPEAVTDGVTGILVDPTDHLAVAAALTTILVERELAAAMGVAGKRRAKDFAWESIANAVERVLLNAAH